MTEQRAESGDVERRVSDALDPILAGYVGPPIPHEAIAIVLDLAQRAVIAEVAQIVADKFAAIEWYTGKVDGYLAESYERAIQHDDCPRTSPEESRS